MSQKTTIFFFTFVTGVELTSWCLLRPWSTHVFIIKLQMNKLVGEADCWGPIWGPMRGLGKNCMGRGQTNTHTHGHVDSMTNWAQRAELVKTWQVTCAMWHVVRDTWHMTYDRWWTLCQNFRSLALTVWDSWCFEDLEKRDLWLSEWVNEWQKWL